MALSALPYQQFLRAKESEFFSLIEQGSISPWLFPHDFLVVAIPILALWIPAGRPGSLAVRYAAFGVVCALSIRSILYTRCLIGGGTIVGFYYAFVIIWSAVFLVFKDVRTECYRIERRDGSFYWQGYPDTLYHRLTWLLDLFSSLRGVGWNWRIPGLPRLPEVDQPCVTEYRATSLLKTSLCRTAVYYVLMDILRMLVMLDPYFWGLIDTPPLPPLDRIYRFSPALMRLARTVISVLWIRTVMAYLFSMVPLFASIIALLPGVSAHSHTPPDAPWLYPPLFANFFNFRTVLDHGLPGWWGRRWHQTYRYAFAETARHCVPVQSSQERDRFLRQCVAFLLSGIMHTCAVHAHFAPRARVGGGSLLFFAVQPVGMLLQQRLRRGFAEGSRWERAFTLVSTYAWLYLSIGPFCDELAAAGTWGYDEPVPVSLARGLGVIEGEGWWVWERSYVRWWRGQKWWQNGIQII
ncbi:wax synthase family protein [Aspergillus clavatus NRRL 1]|uniref:Wax synthase domain-containing protein n=1 Tax=Aspergillus clavatus (strain ATCC 1007 / CBS 513.65 / DSM 816 / NCTC 3887 / NRRL 1 / QM 1276 / 107) TaxID=344612 RepID=A1CLH2_ASPCL|nr:uncharacterized protein ACLA_042180 [Aspergillus clavatus NRRL 1]EAW09996.1 conserved hypothetical protein [Aspergillus clavatus NRRL 1]